ncbi:WecB/TagA/CpsF family glycosyltransferase [Candidatus Omnitrophota bacterium]
MRILDVNYDNITSVDALDKALFLLENNNKSNIFFLNADCLYIAQRDGQYRDILNSADLVLPDGIGLKLATRLSGSKMQDNCNGSDFSPLLMARATGQGYKIFLLGGRQGIAERAARNIQEKIPQVQVAGTHSGYFDNEKEVIDKINGSGADILFVAMGVPLQEKWICRNRDRINPKLCLGVGALLDYLSGNIRRAPKIFRAIHMEWAWRIFIEPKRLWRRYLVNDIKIFWLVLKQRYS